MEYWLGVGKCGDKSLRDNYIFILSIDPQNKNYSFIATCLPPLWTIAQMNATDKMPEVSGQEWGGEPDAPDDVRRAT